ncbi:acyltransferase family protein [Alkalicoccobacillus porphyridii]|uniref:Acyltransferase family protein n=1 Tax=Alkalicoccobacillus porphyridii TaxID=2597270 RepID=A0A554A0J5_9BACI|nr:acyltransferase family protein [Alkalicoccobacillus porphyridii]TSB47219.1 acyltransferase family protein [Alkalicoccobacillus porphyridii]
MSDRVKWIDAAKGIGIILVVMSHAPIHDSIKNFLFAFHMPMFFYLSGIVYKTSSLPTSTFILKKARGLLLPYFIFSFITYIVWFFVTRHFPFTSGDQVDPIVPFSGIFISTPVDYQLTYNPAIWFLTCLFVVEVLFYLYQRLSKGRWLPILLIGCGFIGYLSSIIISSNVLPWSILVALTAIVFYGLGYATKHLWKSYSWRSVLIVGAALYAITFIAQGLNTERIDMRGNIYGEIWYFYIGATAGLIATILLAHKLARFHYLVYLGQYSIVILLLHFPALNLMKASVYYGLNMEMAETTTLPWTLFYTVSTLLLMVPCIIFLKKYPFLLGKKKPKKSQRTVKPA